MGEESGFKEKRRHTRVEVNKYVDFQVAGEPCATFGMVMNVSPAGLLVQGFKDVPIGTRLIIEIVPPKGFESPQGHAVAEIVWKDLCLWDDWEGFQYGLKFIQPSNENNPELKQVALNPSGLKGPLWVDEPGHHETLISGAKRRKVS